MKLILFFASLFLFINANSQCIFPSGQNQRGVTITLSVDSPGQNLPVFLKGKEYALINVVKGFTYTFSVANVFSASNEGLSLYNAVSNENIISVIDTNGASISNWVATYSGQIKLILSSGLCLNTQTTDSQVNLNLVKIGNTLDSTSAFGVNTWVGHVYDWTGSAPPGGASPSTPTNDYPFKPDNYVGYYMVNSQDIVEGFGGSSFNFPLLSDGVNRVNIFTEKFAVRYRMKSTLNLGSYIFTFKGDDGIRMYVDNVKVFDSWKEQSPTIYQNVLVYLDGDTDIIFDFYENGGGNIAELKIAQFDLSTNNVLLPDLLSCGTLQPTKIKASAYTYNSSLVNPTIGFQWQESNDNITFTDILGANSNDYTPLALSHFSQVKYYRRNVFSLATAPYSPRLMSNAIKIEADKTTWNGSTWSNGAPILSKATIINGNYTTAVSGSFSTCNLTVNPTFTFTISANTYVEIQENLTNNGIFKISNTGSLIQINDAGVNTGNISYERIASAKLQDYVYWSSPISGFNVNSISPSTPAYYHWIWNPTVANTNGGLGNWQNASTTMTAGQGYIVRAPNGFSNASVQNWTATFNNGVPFNGVYKPIISRGSYTSGNYIGTNGEQISADDDNWNLLGNPYPSAISINSFLLANTQLDGFVRLWTHNTLPASTASPFYASFSSNYTGADYISINAAGATSGPGTLNVIGGGQGFFTLMLPGVATTSTALFNNAMRKKTLSNSQFYKTTDNHLTANEEIGEDIERNRIWIDLKNPTGETTRTLVAYVEGATLERDRMFDATTDYKSDQNLYSLIGNDIMTIQGRGLPFDVNDTVPMGIKVPTNGTYNIALAAVDGLFSKNAQKIYIEDKLLNTINDITAFPYQFTTNQGIINDRFVLRYTNQMLTNTDFKLNENTITVFGSDNEIKINTSLEKIKNYTVCNVLGQTLAEKNNINTNQSVINTVLKSNQALIVKVTLANGQTIIKKIVF